MSAIITQAVLPIAAIALYVAWTYVAEKRAWRRRQS
jgi:hypothetical protein